MGEQVQLERLVTGHMWTCDPKRLPSSEKHNRVPFFQAEYQGHEKPARCGWCMEGEGVLKCG